MFRALAIAQRDNPDAWPETATSQDKFEKAVAMALIIDQYGETRSPEWYGNNIPSFDTALEAVSAARSSPCKYVFVIELATEHDRPTPAKLVWGVHEQ